MKTIERERPTMPERRRVDATSQLLREARESAERAYLTAANGYAIVRGKKIRGEIE